MTILSLAACLPAVLLGGLLTHRMWPGGDRTRLLLKAALGAGLGLGLASLLYFARLTLLPGQGGFIQFLAALLLLGLWAAYRAGPGVSAAPGAPWKPSRLQIFLLAAAAITALVALLSFVYFEQISPHGRYDAWAIYNLRARFIFRAGSDWALTFSPDSYWNVHADYPLLLPMNIVWVWNALGGESVRAAMVQAGIFMFGTAGVLFAATAYARTPGQAGLAALLLLGAPVFVDRGASQTADVPLAFFILAVCVLLYFYEVHRRPGLLILAGLAAGLAAWTKNDGLPLLAAIIPACGLAFGPKNALRTAGWLVAGLALPAAALVYFKVFLAPPSEFLSDTGGKALDLSRYLLILRYMAHGAWTMGGWPLPILPALIVHRFVFRGPEAAASRGGILAIVIVLGLQLGGYCAAFLMTPYPLEWHLSHSIERLWIQVYPALLFLHFATVAGPDAIGVK
jgi:hypothetical protein